MYYLFPQIKKHKYGEYSELRILKTKPKNVPYIKADSKQRLEEISEGISEHFWDELQKIEDEFEEQRKVHWDRLEKLQREVDKEVERISKLEQETLHKRRLEIIRNLPEDQPHILV